MTKSEFLMETSVDDRTGLLVAAYLRVRGGEAAETREVAEGMAYADYDSDGMLLGVELLGPRDVAALDGVAEREPEPVRQFLRAAAPRGLFRRSRRPAAEQG